jgi:hypothetical protein
MALAAYLERAASTNEADTLERHLAGCASCFETVKELRAGAQLAETEVPPALDGRLRLATAAARPRRAAAGRIAWYAAWAAGLLVAGWLGHEMGHATCRSSRGSESALAARVLDMSSAGLGGAAARGPVDVPEGGAR